MERDEMGIYHDGEGELRGNMDRGPEVRGQQAGRIGRSAHCTAQ